MALFVEPSGLFSRALSIARSLARVLLRSLMQAHPAVQAVYSAPRPVPPSGRTPEQELDQGKGYRVPFAATLGEIVPGPDLSAQVNIACKDLCLLDFKTFAAIEM